MGKEVEVVVVVVVEVEEEEGSISAGRDPWLLLRDCLAGLMLSSVFSSEI